MQTQLQGDVFQWPPKQTVIPFITTVSEWWDH